MHMGGASANDVVRGEDPSGFGQTVALVSVAPAATAGSDAGGRLLPPPAAVEVVTPLELVVLDAAFVDFSPLARATTPTVATTTPTSTATAMMRRLRAARRYAASRACWPAGGGRPRRDAGGGSAGGTADDATACPPQRDRGPAPAGPCD
jgi:hypothetical protein